MRDTSYYSGLLDLLRRRKTDDEIEWSDVADYVEKATGEPCDKNTIRRASPLLYEFDEAGFVRCPETEAAADTYHVQKLEAQKAVIRMRDERSELARIQRELARRDALLDTIKEAIAWNVEPAVGYTPRDTEISDNDLIVHLTDLHAGLDTKNFFNEYNEEVMYRRLNQYLERIDEIRQRHCSEGCYLLLGGDLVSGLIHTATRLENNMNVAQQVKTVSMAVSKFVECISGMFNVVHVYSVPGNHGRVIPKKDDNLKGENLDVLVPFFLTARLANYSNVFVHEHGVEESVAMFSVRGQKVFGVHGDKDNMETVVQKLTMFMHMKPDIVLAGHRHTNGMRTVYDTRVYESGCVSGPDDYCMDHRLRNKPEQTVLVVNENGVDCAYNVILE